MSYEDAAATKMLAVKCCVCSKPLLDANSVEAGMGPTCRERYLAGYSNENRDVANKIVHHCAINMAHPVIIAENCKRLSELGFKKLATKISSRMNLKSRVIVTVDSYERLGIKGLLISTPFRRDATAAWREIHGRCWLSAQKSNFVPRYSAKSVVALLEEFFSGYIIVGDYFTPEHFADEEGIPF